MAKLLEGKCDLINVPAGMHEDLELYMACPAAANSQNALRSVCWPDSPKNELVLDFQSQYQLVFYDPSYAKDGLKFNAL